MGQMIYLSDDELVEVEQALIGHYDGLLEADLPVVDSVYFKVGLALERPWAITKNSALKSATPADKGNAPVEVTNWSDLIDSKDAEIARLNVIINTPQSGDFLRAVSIEAEHQRQRWGADGDAGKAAADWFWLIGYLAGKALAAHVNCNFEKAEHHIITTAAACMNWHAAMFGNTDMRPGIDAKDQA